MNKIVLGLGAVDGLPVMPLTPALGHHSVAMFDHDKKVT
jgi:hypothetical protein